MYMPHVIFFMSVVVTVWKLTMENNNKNNNPWICEQTPLECWPDKLAGGLRAGISDPSTSKGQRSGLGIQQVGSLLAEWRQTTIQPAGLDAG